MRLLALDAATDACSAAVLIDGRIAARRYLPMSRGQAEVLLPLVAEVMAEAGVAFSKIELIAVTVGPGAFTGIRIGLAAARGLALATGLPLAGITTTEAVACAVPLEERQGKTILVALDSKRDELWVQAFSAQLVAVGAPVALLPAEAAVLVAGPLVIVGTAAAEVLALCPGAVAASSPGCPDAAVVGRLAEARWGEGTALPAQPLYLRPADVTL